MARPSPLVVIAEYDHQWPIRYQQQEHAIRGALGAAVLVEHCGSTSVPGLAAKPIIDIVLAVPSSVDEHAYAPALAGIGYVFRLREPDWYEHRLFRLPDPQVNLHIFTTGCVEIDRMLAFRDHLRIDEADRHRYERTKRELARRDWATVQDYADAKTDIVTDILTRTTVNSVVYRWGRCSGCG